MFASCSLAVNACVRASIMRAVCICVCVSVFVTEMVDYETKRRRAVERYDIPHCTRQYDGHAREALTLDTFPRATCAHYTRVRALNTAAAATRM